jgi:hypothetical protein
MAEIAGTFELASWEEAPYDEPGDGSRLTLATVTQTFSGDIEGEGSVRWLMAYRPDGTAHFVGLQRVSGVVNGRRGGFVLETTGDFDGKVATWNASVVTGTGTDELAGISGAGRFGAPHGPTASFELQLHFDRSPLT